MSDDPRFRITWRLNPAQWVVAAKKAEVEPAGGAYDLRGRAIYDLLWGYIQFEYGARAYAPDTSLSLLDMARKFNANLLDDDFRHGSDGTLAAVRDSESELRLYFRKAHGQVQVFAVRHPQYLPLQLGPVQFEVPETEFYPGIEDFIQQVVRAIEQHVPALLAWETLSRIRHYSHDHNKGPDG